VTPERNDEIEAFLAASGWGGAARQPLPGDASTRRYERLALNGRKAMLMDQPQLAETPSAPPDATPEQRRKLGYNALARLAGGDVDRFVAVSNFLRAAGLSAPEVFAADGGSASPSSKIWATTCSQTSWIAARTSTNSTTPLPKSWRHFTRELHPR